MVLEQHFATTRNFQRTGQLALTVTMAAALAFTMLTWRPDEATATTAAARTAAVATKHWSTIGKKPSRKVSKRIFRTIGGAYANGSGTCKRTGIRVFTKKLRKRQWGFYDAYAGKCYNGITVVARKKGQKRWLVVTSFNRTGEPGEDLCSQFRRPTAKTKVPKTVVRKVTRIQFNGGLRC